MLLTRTSVLTIQNQRPDDGEARQPIFGEIICGLFSSGYGNLSGCSAIRHKVINETMNSRASSEPGSDRLIQWLLDGDPAIRWQTLRDLVGASTPTVERERNKITRLGWGARLLARQDSEGMWARGKSPESGLYSPKWTSTTYTISPSVMVCPDPRAKKACRLLRTEACSDGGLNYGAWARWTRRSETS